MPKNKKVNPRYFFPKKNRFMAESMSQKNEDLIFGRTQAAERTSMILSASNLAIKGVISNRQLQIIINNINKKYPNIAL